MERLNFIGILFVLVGISSITKVRKFYSDEAYARNYVETKLDAYILRKLFGVEKALKLTRKIFAPLGFILGLGFLGLGIYLIIYRWMYTG